MTAKALLARLLAYDKNEWIAYRNERSLIPWDDILASGFDAVKCDCGKQGCLGWRLARVGTRPLRVSPPVASPPHPPRVA